MPTLPRTTSRSQPPRPNRSARSRRLPGGFTLTELLVVMGILIILAAVGLPSINAMLNSGRLQNATRTVGSAVAATRTFATRDRAFLTGDYSGAAVAILPTGQLMYVENIEQAKNNSGTALETRPADDGPLNGYARIPNIDMLELPGSIGVAGVVRTGNSANDVNLYAAPFAIRFDEGGSLIAGQSSEPSRQVIYDFEDDNFQTSVGRPSDWDPDVITDFQDLENGVAFDVLETVIAVVVFDRSALDEAGHDLEADAPSATINDDARDWIFQNGNVLMFNRYTGSVVNP